MQLTGISGVIAMVLCVVLLCATTSVINALLFGFDFFDSLKQMLVLNFVFIVVASVLKLKMSF